MSHPQYEPVPQVPPPWPPQAPARGRNPSRFLPILGVALGLLGLVAGVGAWFRATPSKEVAKPAYSDEQVADGSKAVCDAYKKGWQAVQVAGTKKISDPSQPLPPELLNARIGELATANTFLIAVLNNPAALPELKRSVGELGSSYQSLVLTQLADSANIEEYTRQIDRLVPEIQELCR